jgi:hypothetical protein
MIIHRQQGRAVLNAAGKYEFRCICGWTSGYVARGTGGRLLRLHVVTAGATR